MTISPPRARRSRSATRRIPTLPGCGSSSTRRATSPPSSRSSSAPCWPINGRMQRSRRIERSRRCVRRCDARKHVRALASRRGAGYAGDNKKEDATTGVERHGEVRSMMRKLLIAGLAAVAAGSVPGSAFAQFYKGKTITMIVNYPAGGPTDIEGRIVAQHLPAHIPGKPTIVIKNVGGAGGLIGSNQLGEVAKPDGETMGFFTLDIISQIVGNPSLRVSFTDFVLIAGVEAPLVVYARRDTPPGLKVATDIMKAQDFKALSLSAKNSNTINQALSLDLLGIKYQAVPAYRGLKEVETAILQNIGQLANSSLSGWRGSVEPTMGDVVIPLWQLSPRGKDGGYPRSKALPDLPAFEEFFGMVHGGKRPSGMPYEALRASSDPLLAMFRTALMPPKTPSEPVDVMRAAFVELWKDPQFLRDYVNVVKTEAPLVSGLEGQDILAGVGRIKPDVKAFLVDYADRLAGGVK